MDDSVVSSDHSLIIFNLKDMIEIIPQRRNTRYNDKKIDQSKLQTAVINCYDNQVSFRSSNSEASAVTNAIRAQEQ